MMLNLFGMNVSAHVSELFTLTSELLLYKGELLGVRFRASFAWM